MPRYERGPIDGVGCQPGLGVRGDEVADRERSAQIEEQGGLAEQRLAAFGGQQQGPLIVKQGPVGLAEAVEDLPGDVVQLR